MNNTYEEWRDVVGYEGLYIVSNLGNVKSSRNGMLKPILKKAVNYYALTLYKRNGEHKQHHIHILVAEAFIPNPDGLPVVDHINTITTDNRVENLRWVSVKGNVNNEISKKKRLEAVRAVVQGKYGVDSMKHRAVAQYTKRGELVKVWGCMSDAWRALNIDSGSLTRVCQGKRKTAGGFVWKYV